MKAFFSETISTFLLVFFGTGAIVLNDHLNGNVGQIGIGLTFGVSVTLLIVLFSKYSGAHMNPAVSLVYLIKKKISFWKFVIYFIAQNLGALLASLCIAKLIDHPTLGATLPSVPLYLCFILEFMMTFLLMYIILKTDHSLLACALGAGTIVGLEAYFIGPFTGASMNPARSFGPALISNHTEHLWLYFSAPILGAAFALVLDYLIKQLHQGNKKN